MKSRRIKHAQQTASEVVSFFAPKSTKRVRKSSRTTSKKLVAIIPTYKPKNITYRLIADLISWNKNIQVVVVDDSTPLTSKLSMDILTKIRTLGKKNKKVVLLRTPSNQLKSSALNFGLDYIHSQKTTPNVVITLDDDVTIDEQTIPVMIQALYADSHLGVVCSMTWVKNKKTNLLTRLQGLEYHGFNITKIGDNGFLLGPLVMQGMLSAFRYEAIKHVNGFATDKLIEDYDITVRIKNAGWKTAIAHNAHAWTYVPESMGELWKQRIRWSYGGIIVVSDFWKEFRSVFQDLVGHAIFLSLLILVILSLLFPEHTGEHPLLVLSLVAVALAHFIIAFIFNCLTLLTYRDRDKADWFIKLSIFPEFAYSNMLSAILIGSYLFFVFNIVSYWAVKHVPVLLRLQRTGARTFKKLGYSGAWGTRS